MNNLLKNKRTKNRILGIALGVLVSFFYILGMVRFKI